MNEQKVRDAVKIANELVPQAQLPEYVYTALWQRVFDALIYEPTPSTASEVAAAGISPSDC